MSGQFSVDALRGACRAAELALDEAPDDGRAIGCALDRLRAHLGPDLLCSAFVRDHERLWVLAQRGYDTVPDGQPLSRGVMGRAIRTGRTQLVVDVVADPNYVCAAGDVRSELAIPLGRTLPAAGLLNLETRGEALPPGAGRLFGRLRRRLEERLEATGAAPRVALSTLARLFVHVSSLREVDAIAELAARSLGHLLELDAARLYLGAELEPAGSWRRPDAETGPLDPAEAHAIASRFELSPAWSSLDVDGLGVIWLPLRASGVEVGALVGCAAGRLSLEHEQAEAATLLAAHVAASIDAAAALERERHAAVTDPLTGLLNRRGFDDRFQEELARAERTRRPLSLLVLDCDEFKAINDRGGHELGDRALRAIGGLLEGAKRVWDVAARLGGDEFVVLLPEVDSVAARGIAERLRQELDRGAAGEWGALAASLGCSTYPVDGTSGADLLRAADQAMYAAKSAGCNRTVVYGDLHAPGAGEPCETLIGSMLELTRALDAGYLFDHAHSELVGRCAGTIARRLGFSDGDAERLRLAGFLHDIGKVALPEEILRKPGALTEAEWVEVRRHPTIGAHMLERVRDEELRHWIRHHHERPDGRGYPDGLHAGEIPLGALVLSVADAFEAMTSTRPYRAALTLEAAIAELRRQSGVQFDPAIVEALVASIDAGELGEGLRVAA